MFAQERQNRILSYLMAHRRATVTELAEMLATSESTIRRDLQDLEQTRQLQRTHGGAVLHDHALHEPSWQEKDVENAEAKAKIGELAAEMVGDGDTVLLDTGTTTVHIARQLRSRDVTVITNSITIANDLSASESVHLIVLGGDLRANTGALVGPFTEQMLAQMHVDTVFLGANGIDQTGITTPNPLEAATKRAMVRAAKRVVVAADVSKIGQLSFVRVCGWQDVHSLITDGAIDDGEIARVLAAHHVAVRTP